MGYVTRPKRVPHNHPVRAFDVETLGDERKFVCGTFRDENGQRFTTSLGEMRSWLLSPSNAGSIIYATNLFYDYTVVFGGFPPGHHALFTGSKLLHVRVPLKGKGTIRFYDTSNLTNHMSVKQLGRMVGLEKYPTPPLLLGQVEGGEEWVCPAHGVKWCVECYNRRDCEITYQWALRFQRVCKELGCEVKTTIAATAMDLWKRQYAMKRLFMPPEWLNEYVREAYHGGFVFIFRKGVAKDVSYYDMRSLYPFVLAYRAYPDIASMRFETKCPSIDNILKYEGFSRVRVSYPECYFPILPVVINNYLTTCTGEYEGMWTHVELREAIKRGCKVVQVYENIYFTRTIKPFTSYMQDIYLRRLRCQQSDDEFHAVYKLFMNSLSGKFGQRTDNQLYEPVDVDSIKSVKELEGCMIFKAGGREYVIKAKRSGHTPDFVNVIWAAYMTAYARLQLVYHLEQAFPYVYACDTDSVFTTYEYRVGEGLGDMGLKQGPSDWVFQYPKQYAGWDNDGVWIGRTKGVPRDLQPEFFETERVIWKKPATMKESLRMGVEPGTWIERIRQNRSKPDKRFSLHNISPSEGSTDTRPYTYDEACSVFGKAPLLPEWR